MQNFQFLIWMLWGVLSRSLMAFRSKETRLAEQISAGARVGEWSLIYEGPFNSKIRLLKFGSVATFLSSVALSVIACIGAWSDLETREGLQEHWTPKSINDLPVEVQAKISKIGFVSMGGMAIRFYHPSHGSHQHHVPVCAFVSLLCP